MRYSGTPPEYSASRPVFSSHARSATQAHLSRVINPCLSVLMLVCCLDVYCFEQAHSIHGVSVDMSKAIWKPLLVSDMKGDMGRKPKALAALVRNCVNMFGNLNLGLVCTAHTYASQDMFDPDDKISGGQGFIYASSIVVAMRKLKLKEDEDGNKVSEVNGIRAACKIMKTRYAKPFESVQVKIPYEQGMSPYSGMTDMLEGKDLLKKEGNSLLYTLADGTVIKKFRKGWERNDDECLDKVMQDFIDNPHHVVTTQLAVEETTE